MYGITSSMAWITPCPKLHNAQLQHLFMCMCEYSKDRFNSSKKTKTRNYIGAVFSSSISLILMYQALSLPPHSPKTHREPVPGYNDIMNDFDWVFLVIQVKIVGMLLIHGVVTPVLVWTLSQHTQYPNHLRASVKSLHCTNAQNIPTSNSDNQTNEHTVNNFPNTHSPRLGLRTLTFLQTWFHPLFIKPFYCTLCYLLPQSQIQVKLPSIINIYTDLLIGAINN